jgi:hypothetical protein
VPDVAGGRRTLVNRRSSIGLSIVLAATAALAGCAAGGQASSSDAVASSIAARLSRDAARLTATAGAQPQGQPTGKIRVVNLVSADGQPGGPIDLFDVFHPTKSDVPIIKDLAYGQVSDYVSPRAGGPGNPSQLFAYPAGSLQPSGAFTGGNLSQSGWTADQQVTVVLMPGTSSASFGSKELDDAPSGGGSQATATVPAGNATVVTWNADVNLPNAPNVYLTVDGNCAPALDQSADQPGTLDGTFAVPAGTHSLGVLTTPPGSGLTMQQCAGQAASPAGTESLTAPTGGRVDVVGYQDSGGAWKLLVAPVQ